MTKNSVIFMNGSKVWIVKGNKTIHFKNANVTEATRGRINRLIFQGKTRMVLCSFGTWAINKA